METSVGDNETVLYTCQDSSTGCVQLENRGKDWGREGKLVGGSVVIIITMHSSLLCKSLFKSLLWLSCGKFNLNLLPPV